MNFFLTACPKFEQLLWVALVLHDLIVAENEIVFVVTIHLSQQSESGVLELLWQEHSGRHGSLSQSHLHPGASGKHHSHICRGGGKHKHT